MLGVAASAINIALLLVHHPAVVALTRRHQLVDFAMAPLTLQLGRALPKAMAGGAFQGAVQRLVGMRKNTRRNLRPGDPNYGEENETEGE